MGYLCLKCYETYTTLFQNCPKTSCYGYVIEVDDLMLPTIMLLNQKGYYTKFCCSGHTYDKDCYPYVAFDSFLNEMLNENEFNELFKELPKPWYIENNIPDMRTLRCKIKDDDMIKMQKLICDANLKLLDFVHTLPYLLCDKYDEKIEDKEVKVGIVYE